MKYQHTFSVTISKMVCPGGKVKQDAVKAGDDECVPVCNGGKVKLDAVKAGDDECIPVCNGGKVKLDAVQAGDDESVPVRQVMTSAYLSAMAGK